MQTDDLARKVLVDEVQRFKQWAEQTFPGGAQFGEWECEYQHWNNLYGATEAHLGACSPKHWTELDAELLLYVLARDSEAEHVKDLLVNRPGHLIALARFALTRSCDWNCRWQLAVALGEVRPPECEELLEDFTRDKNEYVRRRALLELAKIESPKCERLALIAWNTDEEYQRICALSVLYKVKSPLLPQYLQFADVDGREHLVRCASRIRSGEDFDRL